MDEDRRKILEMLRDGKISVEDAYAFGLGSPGVAPDRRKILEMLQEGKISVEDAYAFGLGSPAAGSEETEGSSRVAKAVAEGTSVPAAERPVPANPKFLRVVIDAASGDKVNIRVPMALIRTGIKMGALIPERAHEQLEHHGVDLAALSQLDPDELVQALAALTVDVDAAAGDTVRIYCE
ncbi:MAG: SHOCT-like domain-containing protein [Planctomycetota bacterium]|jgi:hypothetical protein